MKHSLISPSNFERRMLCPGSLNAEKDLPEVTSKYAEEGKLLHEETKKYIESCSVISCSAIFKDDQNSIFYYSLQRLFSTAIAEVYEKKISEEQKHIVLQAGDYFNRLKLEDRLGEPTLEYGREAIFYENHEKTYDLSFIYPDMKGTPDSVLITDYEAWDNDADLGFYDKKHMYIDIIDYKFGKGIPISAYQNFQLILYYLGVINDPEIKEIIKDKKYSVHLHIVQPYVKNSRWDLNEEERLEIENLKFYQDVTNACYDPNAIRIPSKKACQFCKAKPTCPALANTVPDIKMNIFNLNNKEIGDIYDNRELIKLYLSSIEEYIKDRISDSGFEGYELIDKISNRKWNDQATTKLQKLLGDEAFEITSKLISLGKAEKLLGKDLINNLTTREVIGTEIIKTSIK